MGLVYVVAGPAGVGKNELIKRLNKEELGLTYIPSFTTRQPRENIGEVQGNPYFFVSLSEFMRKMSDGDFIEAEEVHGNWYGTDKEKYNSVLMTGGSVIKDIDVKGALSFKKAFGSYACLIYIAPPSMEELERRLKFRGSGTEEENRLRLSRAEFENSLSVHFDHILVNDDLEETVEKLREIINNKGKVYVNPNDLRFTEPIRTLNMSKLNNLINKIGVNGFDNDFPLTLVRSDGGKLYISDGRKRALASIVSGMSKVPAYISKVRWIPFSGIHEMQYDYEDLIKNLKNHGS